MTKPVPGHPNGPYITRRTKFTLWNAEKSFLILVPELELLVALSIIEWDLNRSRFVTDLTTTQVNSLLFELRNEG